MDNNETDYVVFPDNYDVEGQLSLFDPPAPYVPDINDNMNVPRILIGCIGKVTLFAEQVLYVGLQKVTLRNHATYEGTELGEYYKEIEEATGIDFTEGMVACVKIGELKRQLEKEKAAGRFYNQLDTLMNTPAMVNSWNILYKDENRSVAVNVVSASMYDKKRGEILILFNDRLKARLYELSKGYAVIPRKLMMHCFRTHFGFELYQMLKDQMGLIQSREQKMGYPLKNEYHFTISLAELFFSTKVIEVDAESKNKYMLKAIKMIGEGQYDAAFATLTEGKLLERTTGEKKSKSYVSKWYDFKRYCLDSAFKDINGFDMTKNLDKSEDEEHEKALALYNALCDVSHPSDIHFYYVTNRGGRGAKIESLTFYVRTDKVTKAELNEDKKVGKEDVLPPEFDEAKELFSAEAWTEQNIVTICKAAEWDITKMRTAYQLYKEAPRKSPIGFMLDAIKNGWQPNAVNDEENSEAYPMEWIKEKMGYEDLMTTHPEMSNIADFIFDTIYDTLNSDASSFKINNVNMRAELVRDRMLALNSTIIAYAIDIFSKGNKGAYPSIAYARTILFYAKSQADAGMSAAYRQQEGRSGNKKTSAQDKYGYEQRTYTEQELRAIERRKLGLPPEEPSESPDTYIPDTTNKFNKFPQTVYTQADYDAFEFKKLTENEESKKGKKNAFNDFPQRKYSTADYDDLEGRKLGLD